MTILVIGQNNSMIREDSMEEKDKDYVREHADKAELNSVLLFNPEKVYKFADLIINDCVEIFLRNKGDISAAVKDIRLRFGYDKPRE
jgi:hypothetical protein